MKEPPFDSLELFARQPRFLLQLSLNWLLFLMSTPPLFLFILFYNSSDVEHAGEGASQVRAVTSLIGATGVCRFLSTFIYRNSQ